MLRTKRGNTEMIIMTNWLKDREIAKGLKKIVITWEQKEIANESLTNLTMSFKRRETNPSLQKS